MQSHNLMNTSIPTEKKTCCNFLKLLKKEACWQNFLILGRTKTNVVQVGAIKQLELRSFSQSLETSQSLKGPLFLLLLEGSFQTGFSWSHSPSNALLLLGYCAFLTHISLFRSLVCLLDCYRVFFSLIFCCFCYCDL